MPIIKLPSGHDLFYTVDDFTDLWTQAETVVFLHGLAEKGEAWRAWVPHFARDYRVVRPDQRGFGASTPMPEEFDCPWTFADLAHLASQLDLQRFTWCRRNSVERSPSVCRQVSAVGQVAVHSQRGFTQAKSQHGHTGMDLPNPEARMHSWAASTRAAGWAASCLLPGRRHGR